MLARLQEQTADFHVDADADFDILFARHATFANYLEFLTRVYGFEMPLETLVIQTPRLERIIDLRERARAGLIVTDLFALGLHASEIAGLPQCLAIPQFRGAAEALGWMYVVERAALVHCVVRRHLRSRLSSRLDTASTYLSAYEGVVGMRWRAFGDVLDTVAREPVVAERMVEAAREAFGVQRRWNKQDRPLVRAVG